MMYPIMLKIDFGEVARSGKNYRPIVLTLVVNWLIKPFTMFAISFFFLGTVFNGLIGPEAVDHVKLPLGLDLQPGDHYGVGRVVMVGGLPLLEVPLWRSYLAAASCSASHRVPRWFSFGATSPKATTATPWSWSPSTPLTMLFLYGALGGFLLGVGRLPVPWQGAVALHRSLRLRCRWWPATSLEGGSSRRRAMPGFASASSAFSRPSRPQHSSRPWSCSSR